MDSQENLDKLDMAILRELQKNGRITVTELASLIGLSKTPCQIRMKRLEEQGYILGYMALLDQKKLGTKYVAFVQVSLSDTRTSALKAFNDAVRTIPEIEQCHMTAATFDYLLKVRTSDMESYRAVLGEKISSLPYVTQTSTFVVMENVKDIESKLI
ncbi:MULTISPECIES: Lrp/AsnC family transcriptional regulator [unclassified Oceanobacter]|uniref:Lrp/AsnC family transcriptional regulator n=1 Tax=unclassified Oceanobacter TaxID=2620260 RepID=UPI0026E4752A|nr:MULTISPECIES: Lrp/AsnC ligand binding domain-containing protein [unclassified Oceanobacter]MDO6683191.1 Lrp/AsnC ligand binding domain-containing protein [Oceanobacter sp. 5_MG-2023]MDP2506210.1 Lrp/AsnC ligand binding domain-containing protein [Oceanobacter sp. 3_MG-2023]MDP2547249.1 Lrp/AsnC ligand binding domain-containing protein [Oceanobacter sp. 4_MG-2023]MDP2610576.1 Lrp/AsnC ligand binding domain-containing protein [Oceanobacter sp. 1_MG-2023]MDP2610641.1 Lrp/AsnC ligand binding dom